MHHKLSGISTSGSWPKEDDENPAYAPTNRYVTIYHLPYYIRTEQTNH